jgi:chloramphenicol O-acetyltransferase
MNQESFEFVVYMIHAFANKWNRLPSFVYRKLAESGCILKFLVPNYEILHTQSTDFVVSDIEEYLNVRKVAI